VKNRALLSRLALCGTAATALGLHGAVLLSRSRIWAGDLPAYLVGWRLAAEDSQHLYDLATQRRIAGQILAKPGPVPACPFNYPPHVAAFGKLLPSLSYDKTVGPWLVILTITLVIAVLASVRNQRHRIEIGAIALAAPPTVIAVTTGSILPLTIVGVLLIVGAYSTRGWPVHSNERPSSQKVTRYLAGTFAVCGWVLVAVKPHLAILIAIATILLTPHGRRRQLMQGFVAAFCFIVALPTVTFGISIWSRWIQFLQTFSSSVEGDLLCRVPRTSPNIEGTLTRLHLQPSSALIWVIYGLTITVFSMWVYKCKPTFAHAAMVAAAAVPMTAPHANPQDLLLCIPFILMTTYRWAQSDDNRLIGIAIVGAGSIFLPIDLYTAGVQVVLVLLVVNWIVSLIMRSIVTSTKGQRA
jgi:hypothetical protein